MLCRKYKGCRNHVERKVNTESFKYYLEVQYVIQPSHNYSCLWMTHRVTEIHYISIYLIYIFCNIISFLFLTFDEFSPLSSSSLHTHICLFTHVVRSETATCCKGHWASMKQTPISETLFPNLRVNYTQSNTIGLVTPENWWNSFPFHHWPSESLYTQGYGVLKCAKFSAVITTMTSLCSHDCKHPSTSYLKSNSCGCAEDILLLDIS